jgi:hypothetical protein
MPLGRFRRISWEWKNTGTLIDDSKKVGPK